MQWIIEYRVLDRLQTASALKDAIRVEIDLTDPKLPEGWESATDPKSKQTYYFHREKRDT